VAFSLRRRRGPDGVARESGRRSGDRTVLNRLPVSHRAAGGDRFLQSHRQVVEVLIEEGLKSEGWQILARLDDLNVKAT